MKDFLITLSAHHYIRPQNIRQQILTLLLQLLQRRLFLMALVNKSQQSKTNKAGNFSGGILKLQVPFLNVARMLLYRIQYNIIESKCQVRIFIRIHAEKNSN